MSATMDLPGVGKMKTTYAAVGIAAGVGIILYLRARASSTAAADATATTDPNQLQDPTDPFGDGLTAPPGYGTADPGSAGSGGYFTGSGDIRTGAPTTNAEWSQASIEYLIGLGVDGGALASALGLYLDNKPLTASQADLVRRAIAVMGPPPVGSHTIIGLTNTTVPPPAHLRIVDVSDRGFKLGWDAVPGASSFHVYEGGKLVSTEHGTFYTTRTPRHPGTKYGPFQVSTVSSTGAESDKSSPVYVSTGGGKPAAPHVAVMNRTKTAGLLGWQTVPGHQTYRIYRGRSRIGTVWGTYFTVRGLKPGSRSGPYTVTAVSSAGIESAHSNAVDINTPKK